MCAVSQALGDADFPAVLRQLLPLMKPRGVEDTSASGSRLRKDELGPDELILLLVYLYSLADETQPADHDTEEEEELEKLERDLIGALTLVISRETELSPLLQKLTGERKLLPLRLFSFAEALLENESKWFVYCCPSSWNRGHFIIVLTLHPFLVSHTIVHTHLHAFSSQLAKWLWELCIFG